MAKAARQAQVTHPHPGEVPGSGFLGRRGISPETLARALAAIVPHGT